LPSRRLPSRIFDFPSILLPNQLDMTTTALKSGQQGSQAPSTIAKGYNLKPEDFIKMMVTQLQNQDPLQPEQSDQILSQMSQIGQLATNTQLQQSLTTMMTQSQIGAAGNLIGKQVAGLNDTGDQVQGLVDSVKVTSGSIYLELDNGKELQMSNVTSISPAPSNTTAAGSTTTTGTTTKAA
jgi:flagellar basal-body rod modification protein FlgD